MSPVAAGPQRPRDRPGWSARSSSRSIPLGFIVGYVVQQGHRRSSDWQFLTEDIPIISREPGRRHEPGDRRHAGDHRLARPSMAVPLGVLGAIYLNEYGGQRRARRRHPLHGRRHDRRAVDRDGPVHLHDLGRCSFGLTRASPARSRSACLMLPIVIRSTEEMLKLVPDDLRQASDALGARRWRTIADRRAAGRAARHRRAASMLAIARPPARRRRCCSRSASRAQVELRTCSRARTPRCRCRSSATRRQPFPAAQDRAWGAALTLIVIVFIFTVIARDRRVPLRDRCAAKRVRVSYSGSSPRSHSRMRCSRSASRATRSRLRRNCGS